QRLDAADEAGPGHAHAHRLRVVTVDAADRVEVARVVELLGKLLVGQLVGLLETLHDVAAAELAVDRDDRGVAMEARARLRLGQPLGRLLIGQHEGVAAPVAVVDREGVAEEHPLEPGVALDLLLGKGLAARVAAVLGMGHERRAEVAVVLRWPVLAPLGGIGVVLVDLDDAHVGRPLLGLALEDADQQRGRGRGRCGDGDEDGDIGDGPSHGFTSSARSGPPSPAVSPWPTLAWQWTHRTLSGTSCATIASWQRRQFSWRIRALF